MTPYRIKQHRKRAHHGSHMALVPFIDMLTMLVVFLLLHSSDAEILPNTKNIQIPQSVADLKPHETVTIMVTKDELLVNGRVVGKVAEVAAYGPDQQIIPELRDALKDVLQDAELRRKLAEIGGQAASGSEDLSQLMLADRRKLEELVKFAHISE